MPTQTVIQQIQGIVPPAGLPQQIGQGRKYPGMRGFGQPPGKHFDFLFQVHAEIPI
jgi:hypothetical protein